MARHSAHSKLHLPHRTPSFDKIIAKVKRLLDRQLDKMLAEAHAEPPRSPAAPRRRRCR